jgi:CDP-diacylglycerol--glycerol-3-phosphate 3-phosphatidyltransferase
MTSSDSHPQSEAPPSRRWRRLRRKKPRLDPVRRAERRRSLKEDAVNIPNLLTMGRVGSFLSCCYGKRLQKPARGRTSQAQPRSPISDGYLARKMNTPACSKSHPPATLLAMATPGWSRWADGVGGRLLGREISITGLRSIASSEGVIIAAGEGGKSKTALQMIGIIALIVGYPYHLTLGPYDLGVVDLVIVGRWLVYISLVFSITSAFQYVGLFAEAVEAKERRGSS